MNDLKDQLAKVRVSGFGEALASGYYCFLLLIFIERRMSSSENPPRFFFISRYKYSILSAVPLYLTFKIIFSSSVIYLLKTFFLLKTCRGGWR